MPLSHLLPDSQLVFSAELAAAVGLEEAIMLQQIRGLYLHQPATQRNDLCWLHISEAYLQQLLPFWKPAELRRICRSLEILGLLCIDHDSAAEDSLLLAVNTRSTPHRVTDPVPAAPVAARPAASATGVTHQSSPSRHSVPAVATSGTTQATRRRAPPRREGQPLPPDFHPSEDNLEMLEQFHGIPRSFALQQLEDFSLYWRERGSAGHAWQNKFKQHVQFKWAKHQQDRLTHEHAGQRGIDAARRTRDSSLEQDLIDTSWAE